MFFLSRKPKPKITVIVPVYNKSLYLLECIPSILSQSLTSIEIVFVDDASTDGSQEIIEDFMRKDDRIVLLRNTRNSGPGPARNRGLRRASAAHVQFTDADDVLPQGALELLHTMALQDDLPAVRGTLATFAESPARYWIEDQFQTADRSCFDFRESRTLWLPWGHQCYLFSRRFLMEHKLEYPALRNGEDPVFLLRALLKAQKLSTTSEISYLYRAAKPNERITSAHLKDYITHVETIKSLYLANFPEAWHQYCSEFYFKTTFQYLNDLLLLAPERSLALARINSIWPEEHIGSSAHILPETLDS
jgi:glycosyltransferase involved in cell wall biosynthesis